MPGSNNVPGGRRTLVASGAIGLINSNGTPHIHVRVVPHPLIKLWSEASMPQRQRLFNHWGLKPTERQLFRSLVATLVFVGVDQPSVSVKVKGNALN